MFSVCASTLKQAFDPICTTIHFDVDNRRGRVQAEGSRCAGGCQTAGVVGFSLLASLCKRLKHDATWRGRAYQSTCLYEVVSTDPIVQAVKASLRESECGGMSEVDPNPTFRPLPAQRRLARSNGRFSLGSPGISSVGIIGICAWLPESAPRLRRCALLESTCMTGLEKKAVDRQCLCRTTYGSRVARTARNLDNADSRRAV